MKWNFLKNKFSYSRDSWWNEPLFIDAIVVADSAEFSLIKTGFFDLILRTFFVRFVDDWFDFFLSLIIDCFICSFSSSNSRWNWYTYQLHVETNCSAWAESIPIWHRECFNNSWVNTGSRFCRDDAFNHIA